MAYCTLQQSTIDVDHGGQAWARYKSLATQVAEYEEAQENAINVKADRQGASPPQNEAEWKAHLASGLKPAIDYLLKRFSPGPGGDRYIAVEFYRGAQIFDPDFAKTLPNAEAHRLIDKLRHFHPLDQDGLISAMKLSFRSYKKNAVEVRANVYIL
jgi:hypothetical protein